MPERAAIAARRALVEAAQRLDALGLNRGSTGNVSLRIDAGMLITPTGSNPSRLKPQDLAIVDDEGAFHGRWQPSSEWHFHHAIYAARPDVGAVVHTHSTHATALACHGRALPAFHYMVAVAGADEVPCVPYHTFGTVELSDAVCEALRDRNACLLAHHGLVTCAATMARALSIAAEIESLCESYLAAQVLGEPGHLSKEEMARVIDKFRSYGQTARSAPTQRRATAGARDSGGARAHARRAVRGR
jgi:L-fuculose-phosphate aldolase